MQRHLSYWIIQWTGIILTKKAAQSTFTVPSQATNIVFTRFTVNQHVNLTQIRTIVHPVLKWTDSTIVHLILPIYRIWHTKHMNCASFHWIGSYQPKNIIFNLWPIIAINTSIGIFVHLDPKQYSLFNTWSAESLTMIQSQDYLYISSVSMVTIGSHWSLFHSDVCSVCSAL